MPRRALSRTLLSALVAVASLTCLGQGAIASAATSARAATTTVAFGPLGQDALIAKRLLAVQNLVVVDGAHDVPRSRPLAHRIERLDSSMESLCAGIIRDANTVAAARAAARRAHLAGRASPAATPEDLAAIVSRATADVKKKMNALTNSDHISISDMFEMQMLMNHLSQLSEMASSIVSATNSAITSMARNVKS
jgi:Family of unknown function (DUF5407)